MQGIDDPACYTVYKNPRNELPLQGTEMQQAEMDGGVQPTRMSQEELQEFLASIFLEADQDGTGTLSYKEFKEVVTV